MTTTPEFLILAGVLTLILATLTCAIALSKGYSPILFFLAALILTPILALIIIGLSPKRPDKKSLADAEALAAYKNWKKFRP